MTYFDQGNGTMTGAMLGLSAATLALGAAIIWLLTHWPR
jgi:hypothetical protein